jgi:hypothetical protein
MSPCRSTRPHTIELGTLILCACLLPAPGRAQETRATVAGTVTDDQGAVVPGVTVMVLSTDTNVSYESVTNQTGVFTVQKIQPGPVKVTASVPGFKTFVREGLTLRTGETVTLSIQLVVGALEETLTVSAHASALESNESTLAQTIEYKRISELPLNGRQVYMLMQLTAGTLFTQTTFGATGFSGTRAWDVNGSLSVHGSRTGNNEFLIEGAPNAGTGGGTGSWNYAPPVDLIEEFKIAASSVDASFGRTSGGVINVALRSGTNAAHGSGILLHRGTWLDTNQIQNIRNNISNTGHSYYNFEGMMSGPIQRNRTFFMGGYQGFYENIPFPVTRTIPTAAQLRGDFSQTTTANGSPIVIYDPATTVCNANFSSCTRQPFPGNVIPENRWNPIARSLIPFMPRANATPSTLAGSSNFISSPNIGRYRYNSYLMKIDHQFSNDHRITVTNTSNWGIEWRNENALPAPAIRSDNYPTHRNHSLVTADDTYTITSSTLLNVRFSWDRFDEPHEKVFGDVRPNLPFQGPYQVTGPPFPQVNISGYEGMFPRTFRRPKNDAYSINSNITRMMGRHLVRAGGESRAYQFFREDEVASNGSFDFGNDFTRRDPLSDTGATSGNGFATFLLGLPTGGAVTLGTPRTEQYRYYAAYLQDDWKIGPNTTVNLGMRWDYEPAVRVKDNLTVSGFDFDAVNPLQSQLAQGAATINPATGQPLAVKGGLLFANRGGPGSPYKNDWNNIQPRIGLIQRINSWLSARASYGRTYLGLSSSGQVGVYTTDFQRNTPYIAKAPNGVDPGQPWANPYPSGFLQPLAGELALLTGIGTGFTIPNRDFEVPYTDQWMAGADVQLPFNVGLDVAYVGNQVSKLGVSRNLNVIPRSENDKAIPSLGGNTGYLNVTFPNPFAGLVSGQGLNAATVSRGTLLRPYPEFGAITMNRLNHGAAYYHALEAAATRRYSNGLKFAVNYTWMKLEDKLNFLTDWDAEPYRDVQGDQREHRVAITALVDLPFGPGRKIGGNTRGFIGGLIRGWQFNAIGEIQSGRPLGLNGAAIQLDPDVALPTSEQSFQRWFDNSSTAQNNPRPDGTFAWSVLGPNDYRVVKARFHDVNEPTEPQWSFSLFKNISIGNGVTMQLRAETFNVFNVRIYGGPNTDPRSANFGIVDTASQVNFPRQTQIGLKLLF